MNKRLELGHVRLFRVRGLVGQVLKHLGNVRERALRVLSGCRVDEHVRSGRNNGRVDETEEEEATDKCADCLVLRIRVFPSRQAANLLADPANTVGCLLESLDDG